MRIKIRPYSILLCLLEIITRTYAASYLYSADSSKDFAYNPDLPIRTGNAATTRSATWKIDHGIKGPYSFVFGILDFNTVNLGALNLALYNSTYINGSTTMKIDVYPYTGLYYLSYHAMFFLTGNFSLSTLTVRLNSCSIL